MRRRELDVVRVLTCASVIAVHVISHTAHGQVGVVGALVPLHATREVFFALSGFVLVLSLQQRPRPLRSLWARRFLLVGAPYLTWSVIYCEIAWAGHPVGWPAALGDLALAVATGKAWYHLYFLFVLMQLYLLLPLLVRLVRATRAWHPVLVALAFGVQLTVSGFDAYAPGSLHALNLVSNVVDYAGFIVGGAVAADHAAAVLAWTRRHRRGIAAAVATTAAATVAGYVVQLAVGFGPYRASTAYQPIVIAWAAVAATGLLALGCWCVDRRPGASHPALDHLADRSFGVYLAHPLVLWAVLSLGDRWLTAWGPVVAAVVVYPVVVAGAFLIAEAARRTPLSLPLAGRR
jgi:peptidoglycan/LPS O-acetylase OafA/YrhL